MWKILQNPSVLICSFEIDNPLPPELNLDSDQDDNNSLATIRAEPPELPPQRDITKIIFRKQAENIEINLHFSEFAPLKHDANNQTISFAQYTKNRLATLSIDPLEIIDGAPIRLKFSVDISKSLTTLNDVLDELDHLMHEFPKIRTAGSNTASFIDKLVKPPRHVVVATATEDRKRISAKIERNVESNMLGIIVSARLSEDALRFKYNFPKPDYSYYPMEQSSNRRGPKPPRRVLHDYTEVPVLRDYVADFEDEPEYQEDTSPANYSVAENNVIEGLLTRIYDLAKTLEQENYLIIEDGSLYPSSSTMQLLYGYHTKDADDFYANLINQQLGE